MGFVMNLSNADLLVNTLLDLFLSRNSLPNALKAHLICLILILVCTFL